MSHFQIETSSVIKTAPPGRQNAPGFSPKHEPIDMSPLTQANLQFQDLSKMQPSMEQYYMPAGYSRMYSEYVNAAAQPLITAAAVATPSSANQIYYPAMFQTGSSNNNAQEWRPVDHYANQRYQAATLQYAHSHPQQANAHDISHENPRIYKALNVEMLSPVDSGIGAELSLLDPSKHDFFVSAGSAQSQQSQSQLSSQSQADIIHSIERRDTAHSHRDSSPIIIPKLQNTHGFQYVLEAPISTSIRREDDRMTYVNKGQFYTISLDYLMDPTKPLKSATVRSLVMVVFREDKTYEDEIKTWQLWHKRQHSTKQRILEVDAKNTSGIIGQIEEIAHNAVQFCWSPNEHSVKISVAVQCLSTDFSTQKGVKGLPLHIQIDTYDDADNDKIPFHRGYSQIKVFCDKGANRKLLHEARRDEKRKDGRCVLDVLGGGRKKSDGEFHDPCERSEFYHMSDLEKPSALFVPSDDFDTRLYDPLALAFDVLNDPATEPLAKRPRTSERGSSLLRQDPDEMVMIYVRKRQDTDTMFIPLHLVPPSLTGLRRAVAEKFNVEPDKIANCYKQCLKGVTVQMDDDMIKHYSNQDTFVIEIEQASEDPSCCTVTLIEYQPTPTQQSYHITSAIAHTSNTA
uniref:Grh/CP2 DB domain-containing protein n=1 Tax=Acrobeloides nanus TaxID=290746 RepID=A0A914CLV2_9BILA